jgi:hypothetical protein
VHTSAKHLAIVSACRTRSMIVDVVRRWPDCINNNRKGTADGSNVETFVEGCGYVQDATSDGKYLLSSVVAGGEWGSSSHERDSLKPSTAELGLGPRQIVRASPQRLGKSLKSFRAERWGCDTAVLSWQPDQPDEGRTRLSRTHVSDLPRRAIAALPCGVLQSLLYEHPACQT